MGITLSRYTHFVIVHHTFSNSSFDHKPHENHTYLIRTTISSCSSNKDSFQNNVGCIFIHPTFYLRVTIYLQDVMEVNNYKYKLIQE